MTFRAHVENGAIVIDDSVTLEEGMRLEIAILNRGSVDAEEIILSRRETIQRFAGVIDGMPADWSENHDFYLRASILGDHSSQQ